MTDLEALLRRAFSDPGQFCARERWEWEYETIPSWGARAAAKALADAGLLLPPDDQTPESDNPFPGLSTEAWRAKCEWLAVAVGAVPRSCNHLTCH